MSRVNDCNLSRRRAVGRGAGKEMRDGVNRILRGGKADALQAVTA